MDPQMPSPLNPELNIETPLKDLQTRDVLKPESPEDIKTKKTGSRNIRFSTLTGVIIILIITVIFIFIPWPECQWFKNRTSYPQQKLQNCPKSISIWQLIQFSLNEKSKK